MLDNRLSAGVLHQRGMPWLGITGRGDLAAQNRPEWDHVPIEVARVVLMLFQHRAIQ
jgi:hypothetical protein